MIRSELSSPMKKKPRPDKLYYYIDLDLYSRQIVNWGIEAQETVEVQIKNGMHRVFLSKGQYNKLETKLTEPRF